MSLVMLKPLSFCFFLFSMSAFGQTSVIETSKNTTRATADSTGSGSVIYSASQNIITIEKNSRGLNNLQGYRIQIFFGPLDQAKAKRQEFMLKGLVHQAYLEQNVPDFSLRVGDFLTESEARQELKNLRPIYPNAFLVKGHIEPPNLNYYINAIKDFEN